MAAELMVNLHGPQMWHYSSGMAKLMSDSWGSSTATVYTFHDSTFWNIEEIISMASDETDGIFGLYDRCDIFQRSKDEIVAYSSTSIQNQSWRDISKGNYTISVHFVGLSHPSTAIQVVEKFCKRIYIQINIKFQIIFFTPPLTPAKTAPLSPSPPQKKKIIFK